MRRAVSHPTGQLLSVSSNGLHPDSITGNRPEVVIVIKEEKTRKDVSLVEKGLNHTREEHEQASICSICTKPATQLVDGDPSCDEHVEQVYEHQVEDYTVRHLVDNEWRKV